jgi:hypothetical protein
MPNFGPPTPNRGFTAPTDNNDGPDYAQGVQTLTTQIDTALGGVVSESSTYTAANGNIVNCTGSGSFTITSPSAAVNAGFTVFQQGTGVVTVSAASGVIYGPGLGSSGASSFTLGISGAYAVLVSDGTNWFITGGGANTGWIAPTLVNSWANAGGGYETAGYLRDALGFVHLKGTLLGGPPNTSPFTLPAGYRPGADASYGDATGAPHYTGCFITSAGVVTINTAFISGNNLAGVTFLAEN